MFTPSLLCADVVNSATAKLLMDFVDFDLTAFVSRLPYCQLILRDNLRVGNAVILLPFELLHRGLEGLKFSPAARAKFLIELFLAGCKILDGFPEPLQ